MHLVGEQIEISMAAHHYSTGLGFTENPWGTKACKFITSMKKFKNSHWGAITNEIFKLNLLGHGLTMDLNENDNGNEGNVGTRWVNPHARIEIDWCVQHSMMLSNF